jgi:mRNA interferase RelE/StbE
LPPYTIRVTPPAAKQLRKLPAEVRRRVRAAIDGLVTDPRPPGAAAMSGGAGLTRIRVGDYRVIYLIRDKELIVVIVKVGHRGDVYE